MTVHAPKDRPIIFSAPMVRALLDGRKSQTRRVLKPQPPEWVKVFFGGDAAGLYFGENLEDFENDNDSGRWWPSYEKGLPIRFAKGDRLWVRETWKPHSTFAHLKPREMPPSNVFFAADERYAPSNTKWVPPIHMPRWASRLTLIVTDVRVQRLQDISEDDAKAEGAVATTCANVVAPKDGFPSYRSGFGLIWNTINGEGAWDANPWVVAVSFRTIKANIDSAEAKAA